MNFALGGGLGVQGSAPVLLGLAALLGLGVGVVAASSDRHRRRGDCCGTGNVPQVIPQDLCLSQHPASCCPVIT